MLMARMMYPYTQSFPVYTEAFMATKGSYLSIYHTNQKKHVICKTPSSFNYFYFNVAVHSNLLSGQS